jgi:hypothetical protein
MYVQYIQCLFRSRLGTADYALVTSSLHYNDSLVTVTGNSFQYILDNWLLSQLNTNYDDCILQLDGAPPHFYTNVRVLLYRVPSQRWIGRAANGEKLLPWPPRSPDLTPCGFYL